MAGVVDGDLGITFRKPGAPLEVKIDGPKMSEDRRTASEDQMDRWTSEFSNGWMLCMDCSGCIGTSWKNSAVDKGLLVKKGRCCGVNCLDDVNPQIYVAITTAYISSALNGSLYYPYQMKMVHVAKKCVICARLTSDFSYGVDCCSACKMFFRRHVVKEALLKPCLSGNQACPKDFLAGCQFCRFHKCLQSGMTLEPLVPKLPLEELFEKLSDFDRHRNRILSDYHPLDPDLNVSTILFFKKLKYQQRNDLVPMKFSSWIYISSIATIEFMKKLPFIYLANSSDQLILVKSSFIKVSSFSAASRAYFSNQHALSFPDGSDVLPFTPDVKGLEEIGNRIRTRLVSKFIELQLSKEEFLLVLILIFCNPALLDLSETGQILVSTYQSVYSNALFEYCMETYEKLGPCRYTELLSLITLAEKHLEDVNNYFVILQLHGMDFLIPAVVKEGINLI
ncbi:hypothetical protein L3Y34_006635 [Caenorhabditis briggsae]|uniref:Uncharacterized protein n=2 Tax=Caenorhabditis briggsae TaxID=6238 RepID=A0AAE9CYP9_CAEBR|nr:hypothetical protein L3Y34_006635 [Caenorhabditis briggsae]